MHTKYITHFTNAPSSCCTHLDLLRRQVRLPVLPHAVHGRPVAQQLGESDRVWVQMTHVEEPHGSVWLECHGSVGLQALCVLLSLYRPSVLLWKNFSRSLYLMSYSCVYKQLWGHFLEIALVVEPLLVDLLGCNCVWAPV